MTMTMEQPATDVTPETCRVLVLGRDRLGLDLAGLRDDETLKLVAKVYPLGLNLLGNNEGPAWINPKAILGLASPDGFGIEFTGFAHVACELLRLANDPIKADELGHEGCDRMLAMLITQAHTMATGKAANQLHAVRFGVGAKIALADRVAKGIIEVHPDGAVAKALARAVELTPGADPNEHPLEGLLTIPFVNVRHPFLMNDVFYIAWNTNLSRNVMLGNREQIRRITKGDQDGDALNLFGVLNEDLGPALALEMRDAFPEMDPTLTVRGLAADQKEAEMWGENIYEDGKTTEKKLNQEFTHSVDEWLNSHIRMGECTNTYTPFSYRISDICSLLAALGIEGGREAALIGAVLEEDFYLSGAGGPECIEEALEAWMRNQLGQASQREDFFASLVADGDGVMSDLFTEDVKQTLLDGATINKQEHDPLDPVGALTHFGWLVGKGRVTTDPQAIAKLGVLVNMSQSLEPEIVDARGRFLVQLAFHAARKLSQVLIAEEEN